MTGRQTDTLQLRRCFTSRHSETRKSPVKNFGLLFVLIALLVFAGRAEQATAATLTTLHSFIGSSDGREPLAALVQGTNGNFYGTTFAGGIHQTGTIFTITRQGTLTTLYSFTGGLDGAQPEAGLVLGIDGNFYGTAAANGLASTNAGTVFTITPSGTLTTLYRFSGGSDGARPLATLVQGPDTNFYGTTLAGGTNHQGVVFKITPAGTLTTLWQFNGITDGNQPVAGLVQGTNGNFYGTTFGGGAGGFGTVFTITPTGTVTTLHNFTGGADGGEPVGGLVLGSNNRFYGTTFVGGNGTGTVFKIGAGGGLTTVY